MLADMGRRRDSGTVLDNRKMSTLGRTNLKKRKDASSDTKGKVENR